MWCCASSELAWRLANLAAIPCEMIANCKDVEADGVQRLNYRTHSEEHPTTDENHLFDGIWLIGEATIFTFQVFQGYRYVFRRVLEWFD